MYFESLTEPRRDVREEEEDNVTLTRFQVTATTAHCARKSKPATQKAAGQRKKRKQRAAGGKKRQKRKGEREREEER